MDPKQNFSSGGSAFRWSVSEDKRRALLEVTCLSLPFHLFFGPSCICFDKSRPQLWTGFLTVCICRQNDAPNWQIGPTKRCTMSVRLQVGVPSSSGGGGVWQRVKRKRALLPTSNQSLSSFSPCQLWKKRSLSFIWGQVWRQSYFPTSAKRRRHFLFWIHWSKLKLGWIET